MTVLRNFTRRRLKVGIFPTPIMRYNSQLFQITREAEGEVIALAVPFFQKGGRSSPCSYKNLEPSAKGYKISEVRYI